MLLEKLEKLPLKHWLMIVAVFQIIIMVGLVFVWSRAASAAEWSRVASFGTIARRKIAQIVLDRPSRK